MRPVSTLFLWLLGGFFANFAWGFMAGPILVYSNPGEPFFGAVVISGLEQGEADQLDMRVSDKEAFEKRGVDYNADYLKGFGFRIESRGNENSNQALMVIRNADPLPASANSELSVLFDISSKFSGTQTRLYRLKTEAAPSAPPPQVAPPQPTEAASVQAVPPPAPAPALVPVPLRKVDIITGDTLGNVARAVQISFYPDRGDVSKEQIMTALRRQNPQNLNPNDSYELIPGRISLPDLGEIQAQPQEEARAEIRAYYKDPEARYLRTATASYPRRHTLVVGDRKQSEQKGEDWLEDTQAQLKEDSRESAVFHSLFSSKFIRDNLFLILFVGVAGFLFFVLAFLWASHARSDDVDFDDDDEDVEFLYEPNLGLPQRDAVVVQTSPDANVYAPQYPEPPRDRWA